MENKPACLHPDDWVENITPPGSVADIVWCSACGAYRMFGHLGNKENRWDEWTVPAMIPITNKNP